MPLSLQMTLERNLRGVAFTWGSSDVHGLEFPTSLTIGHWWLEMVDMVVHKDLESLKLVITALVRSIDKYKLMNPLTTALGRETVDTFHV